MTILKVEKERIEAEKRIQILTEKYNLNPNILKYFKEGRVYYSYLTAGGLIGSIDTISYDQRYENAAREFERENEGYIVYHAVLTETDLGEVLSLLYVTKSDENDLDESKDLFADDCAFAYNVNLTYPQASEFGYIVVSQFGESGALIRIG